MWFLYIRKGFFFISAENAKKKKCVEAGKFSITKKVSCSGGFVE